jgi:hypothetical protein
MAPNGTFCVSVQASNAAGAGLPHHPGRVFSVPVVPPPPGPPTNLTQDVRGATVDFSWNVPPTGGTVAQYFLVASMMPGGPRSRRCDPGLRHRDAGRRCLASHAATRTRSGTRIND